MKKILKKIVPQSIQKSLRKIITKIDLMTLFKWIDVIAMRDNGFIILSDTKEYGQSWRGWDKYYSQVMQDYYLDTFCFKGKENGFFLDIGANAPVWINNTYFFEKERGWTGIAFEPMPKKVSQWAENRKTECIQCALGKENGRALFYEHENHASSGIAGRTVNNDKVINQYEVDVYALKNILSERNIKHVDFVSLDVEGVELDVLKGIDFDTVSISVLVIENNKYERKDRRKFLYNHGYHLQARLWWDEVWIKDGFDIDREI